MKSQDEIKAECQSAYKQIREAQAALESLRVQCLHNSTIDGLYSYRDGAMAPAIICSDCGSLIMYKMKDKGI